ncbi:MAG: type V CRISPR-associated protein Cas12a/Cpf1 [bacterium]|nr:type V CRISPR-associated protein Cas12a/Cpf1 [bacterium]
MKSLNEFTGKYALSKTLRFELKPQGKTLEHIEAKGLINQDEERDKSYKEMKKTIDGFHKHFIEMAMAQVNLTQLEAFAELYNAPLEQKKEDNFKEGLEKVQTDLRKEIAKGFSTGEAKTIFLKIDKKELITELLEDWIEMQRGEDIYFDEKFKKFTTYFGGFHENRKNMYTDKAQTTAIAYRLVHENLPKFLDNIKIFERLTNVPELYEKCAVLYEEIEEYLNITCIAEAFELGYYNEVLTQKRIDVYNLIIGGRSPEEGKKKIQGLNEYINLYNQKQDKRDRIPKLKVLYKQILSDRGSASFLPEAFEESQGVLDAIEEYYRANLIDFKPDDKDDTENVLEKTKTLLTGLKDYDLNKIYLRNDTKLSGISQRLFGSYAVFGDALEHYYATIEKPDFLATYQKADENKRKKLDKEQQKFTKQPYIPIALLQAAINGFVATLDENHEVKKRYSPTCIADYFHAHFLVEKKGEDVKEFDLIANINAKYSCIKGILNTEYPEEKRLNQDKKTIDDIKAFLDSLMELLHFVKPLALPNDSALEKDETFYSHFETYYGQLQLLIPLYNKVRNYATQKPYSTEKFKLNFENAQLLDGWDANKERDYLTSILRKDGNYYLAIMNKHHNKVFQNIKEYQTGDCYEKIVYKLLPGVNKMLPKVFFSNKNIDYFSPSEELLDKYQRGTHKKGDDFSLTDCHNLIDFFKKSLNRHKDWKYFNFNFSPTNSYNDLSDFYREVSHQGYKITFDNISVEYINDIIDQGKLYLFQIYNKDFSPYSKGKPNLHTIYWKALFEPENLKNVVYKLNGQAEMFYRRKSIQDGNQVMHKANEPVENKNPNSKKKESVFEYDIIKDKRYTVDKFQFHVPITLNFKATGNEYINADVLDYLKNNPDVNIIGIDRGERHLIYLTMIDQQGNILQQESLNTIVNKQYNIETPYHKLLDKREGERDKARKDWGTIETIKELKEGYLSQVIHKIAKMMVEHNAIVVMEDLNFGFKRGRFKVEKQVYQKLEKMLIDKLNYLVFKDKKADETSGLYNALQLTNKFESFQKMGKQSGFLFYVPAWNTSKIDPTTGFVNLFDTRYQNVEKAQTFFGKFESIGYNSDKNYFEFEVSNYALFNPKADETKQDWVICTHGDRIRTFRNPEQNNQWDNKEVALTDEFKTLFEQYRIDCATDLQSQIISQNEKDFFEKLLYLFRLTLQMRNSITGSEVDYLISPVMNGSGKFYDSREADDSLPKDADANGAYHIAKKGLWVLEQISEYEGENWKKLNLDISNKKWLQFAQERS